MRCRVIVILICLLLGVLINVAVAWVDAHSNRRLDEVRAVLNGMYVNATQARQFELNKAKAPITLEYGWPFHSLTKDLWLSDGTNRARVSWRFGLLYCGDTYNMLGAASLPIRPSSPSFAVNSLIFGIALVALFVSPGWIRCRRRALNNVCVRCGYDLRGSASGACPECGAAVTAS